MKTWFMFLFQNLWHVSNRRRRRSIATDCCNDDTLIGRSGRFESGVDNFACPVGLTLHRFVVQIFVQETEMPQRIHNESNERRPSYARFVVAAGLVANSQRPKTRRSSCVASGGLNWLDRGIIINLLDLGASAGCRESLPLPGHSFARYDVIA